MPRFHVERILGDITDAQLDAAAEHATRVREERFPEISWERSHVARTPEGLTAFCIYGAPDAQAIRDHAAAAGLPADVVLEIERDLLP